MLRHLQPGQPGKLAIAGFNLPIEPLLTAAAAGQPLEPVIEAIVHRLGFDSFLYAMSTDPRPLRDSRSYVWTTLPREWVACYDRNSYIEIDPGLINAYKQTAPYLWDRATIAGDHRVRRFLDDAALFGIRSGVVVSFRDPHHARIVVALNSAISPVDKARTATIMRNLGDVMLLATHFHDIFMSQFVDPGSPSGRNSTALTRRERQCLELVAHGMTSADIGIKLEIAERTANFHVGNALTKLGALNRSEAIAKAVRLGVIRMDL